MPCLDLVHHICMNVYTAQWPNFFISEGFFWIILNHLYNSTRWLIQKKWLKIELFYFFVIFYILFLLGAKIQKYPCFAGYHQTQTSFFLTAHFRFP